MRLLGSSRNRRGAALILALFFSMILFMSAVAFLTYLERDSALQLSAQRSARAIYLAKAGVEYFCYRQYEGDFGQDRTASGLSKMVDGDVATLTFGPDERVEVTCVGSTPTGCKSKAIILDTTGQLLASRTYIFPQGIGPSIPVPKALIDAGQ
jgi:hypothetical protein